jgi:hypothetical protein
MSWWMFWLGYWRSPLVVPWTRVYRTQRLVPWEQCEATRFWHGYHCRWSQAVVKIQAIYVILRSWHACSILKYVAQILAFTQLHEIRHTVRPESIELLRWDYARGRLEYCPWALYVWYCISSAWARSTKVPPSWPGVWDTAYRRSRTNSTGGTWECEACHIMRSDFHGEAYTHLIDLRVSVPKFITASLATSSTVSTWANHYYNIYSYTRVPPPQYSMTSWMNLSTPVTLWYAGLFVETAHANIILLWQHKITMLTKASNESPFGLSILFQLWLFKTVQDSSHWQLEVFSEIRKNLLVPVSIQIVTSANTYIEIATCWFFSRPDTSPNSEHNYFSRTVQSGHHQLCHLAWRMVNP